MDAASFLRECQRFVVAVSKRDPTVVDVGLHGRNAVWSLETETDPLGTKQPVLVGRYSIVVDKKTKQQDAAGGKANEGDDEHDEDPLAAPIPASSANRRTLHVVLYVTFNQPYGVPALDFVASEAETGGQPLYEVQHLRPWLPELLDALELDARQAALIDSGDESARLLSAAPAPRVSVAVHELLNRPTFSVHACDTVAHLKMLQAFAGVQSPIDAVLAFFGRFLKL